MNKCLLSQIRPWWQTEETIPPKSVLITSALTEVIYWRMDEEGYSQAHGASKTAASPEASHRVGDSSQNCIPAAPWGTSWQLHIRALSPSAIACGLWRGTPWGLELWPTWTSSVSWVLQASLLPERKRNYIIVLYLHLWLSLCLSYQGLFCVLGKCSAIGLCLPPSTCTKLRLN